MYKFAALPLVLLYVVALIKNPSSNTTNESVPLEFSTLNPPVDEVVPLLVAAIKELTARVAELEAK